MMIQKFESNLFRKFLMGRASCILCCPRERYLNPRPRFFVHKENLSCWLPSNNLVGDADPLIEVPETYLLYDERNEEYLVNAEYLRCIEYSPTLHTLYNYTIDSIRDVYNATRKMNAIKKNEFLKHRCMGCACMRIMLKRTRTRYSESIVKKDISVGELLNTMFSGIGRWR